MGWVGHVYGPALPYPALPHLALPCPALPFAKKTYTKCKNEQPMHFADGSRICAAGDCAP